MPSAPIRLFAAIPVPGPQGRALLEWLPEGLGDNLPFRKQVHPADLHITVFFLGDTDEGRLPVIHQALSQAAAASSPFSLHINALGCFGAPHAPRVLWAGTGGAQDSLHLLHQHVCSHMAQGGFTPEDRPYKPHITLARQFKPGESWQGAALLQESVPVQLSKEWLCDSLSLFRTHMGRSPMYETIASYPFIG